MAEFSRKHRSPVQSTDTGRKLYATRSLIRYGPQRVENILEEKGLESENRTTSPSSSEGVDMIEDLLVSSVGGRRLQMEHTYIQLGENNLQNALLAYQTALRLPTNFPGREKLVWQSAFAINQIRLKLDDAVQELSDKLVCAGASVMESRDWVLLNSSSLSPHQSMVALHTKSNDTIQFTTGSLAGQAYTVSEIQQMATAGWAFVHPIFLAYGAILLESGRKMMSLEHIGKMEPQLRGLITNLIAEYWAWNNIMVFTDFKQDRDNVFWKRLSKEFAAFSFASDRWLELMTWIKMSAEQVEKCVALRLFAKHELKKFEMADVCLYDILSDAWQKENAGDMVTVLDSVEAARKNNLDYRTMTTKAALSLLFGILTPLQMASLIVLITSKSEQLIAFWEDWILVFYGCLMNGWMDVYKPPR